MTIPKVAAPDPALERRFFPAESCRAAFGRLMRHVCPTGATVLLPAYVGHSPREGSGVLDPVLELGLRPEFYGLTRTLEIDLEHFESQLLATRPALVVVIHYFGRPDPCIDDVVRIAVDAGVGVVEDEAHAMLTDLVLGRSGRSGMAALFSLHKILPVTDGGVLAVRADASGEEWLADWSREPDTRTGALRQHDLPLIARRRMDNGRCLADLIDQTAVGFSSLWPGAPVDWVPQTWPIVVDHASRDSLYEEMNERGFGVVSLYHTLVSQLPDDPAFDGVRWLARRVMNLPVHQATDPDQLGVLLSTLTEVVGISRGA